ncbi:MAG: indolepyruvate oxidoreductase subunit beta [Sedimentisphaerales bacterium]|nr:indolepyruvate oxidoreductase subunit beta [Sedimentisphaerales bacterium]
MSDQVTNIVVAGLGGQGVLKASDIIAEVAFAAGLDVKKAEVHGMSQRGGSVTSDVRFGQGVLSPMVPAGQADYLVVLDETQVENNKAVLKPEGELLTIALINPSNLKNKRTINVAMLGALSKRFDIDEKLWTDTIKANLPQRLHEVNMEAFALGRQVG